MGYPIRGRSFDDYAHGPAGILSLENANRIAFESGAKSVWNMNQVFSNTSPGIGPRFATPAEHRLGNYISLATGGRTIQYFSVGGYLPHASRSRSGYTLGKRIVGFGTPVGAPMLPAGREVFKQGQIPPVYGPLLIPTTWDYKRKLTVSCADLPYRTASKNKKVLGVGLNVGKDYDVLVVYNRDTLHTRSGTVTLTDVLGSRNIYSLFDDKRVPGNGGVLSTGPLEPGDGRMYVLCTSGVFQRIREAVARNKYMLKKRLFDFYYREQRNSGRDMRAFEEIFTQVADDVQPEPALAALEAAYVGLKTREDGCSSFAETHALLKTAQTDFVTIAELQVKYLSRPDMESINALVDNDDYQAWYDEAVKLSDTYVLLRNLLYFGRSEEALPLLKRLVALIDAQLTSNQNGRYVSVGAKEIDALHAEALALNDFDLLEALRANVN